MDELKQPIIIKFGTCNETNEQIFDVYLKTIKDGVMAASSDLEALERFNRLGKELVWITDELIFKLKQKES